MICKKCGNEVQENENYCGKCGFKVNQEINEDNIDKSKRPITIKFNHLIIGIIVCCIIVFFLVVQAKNNKLPENTKSETSNNLSSTQTSEKKEYYDFIDTDYYTFDFTEDELIKGLCNGDYTKLGFSKFPSNNDRNANIYSIADYYGVNTITITNDPRNFKVKKLEISYISHTTLTKETSDKQASDMYVLGLTGIIFARDKNNYSTEKQKEEIQEILNQLANSNDKTHKGLKLSINRDTKDIDICYEIIK